MRQDAKMTDLESVGKHDAALQGHTTSEHHDHHPSERSSEFEYEIAKQLIQHSQGRRETSGLNMAGASNERSPSLDFGIAVPERNGDHRPTDPGAQPQEVNSRTSSQERVSDTHYAPITIPPALGQICR